MFEIKELKGGVRRDLRTIFEPIVAKLRILPSSTKRALKQTLSDIGKDLKKDALELIDKQPKTGRVYRIRLGGRIITHVASAAGEAPAVLTGRLRRSIDYKVIGYRMLEFASYDVPYAKFLEYENLVTQSGQGSKNIEPRPFLSAAFKAEQPRFESRIRQALIKASRR